MVILLPFPHIFFALSFYDFLFQECFMGLQLSFYCVKASAQLQ